MAEASDTSDLDEADEALIAYAKSKIYINNEDEAAATFWSKMFAEESRKWITNENRKYKRRHRLKTRAWA